MDHDEEFVGEVPHDALAESRDGANVAPFDLADGGSTVRRRNGLPMRT